MNNNTKQKSWKKVASVILNVIIWIFVAFALLVTILVFSAQNSPDGIPAVFGKSLLTVATDSMHPTFSAGDMIIMEKLTPEEVSQLKVGDIITYRSPVDLDGDGRNGDVNTHKIVGIDEKSHGFITKGDNNPIADNEGSNPYTVPNSAVIGIYTGTHIGGLGSAIAFMRTSLGFFLCVVLPMILFFAYELYNFIHVLVTERRKKAADTEKLDEEEIKRRAIEEYLAQQKAKEAEAASAEEAKPAEEAVKFEE